MAHYQLHPYISLAEIPSPASPPSARKGIIPPSAACLSVSFLAVTMKTSQGKVIKVVRATLGKGNDVIYGELYTAIALRCGSIRIDGLLVDAPGVELQAISCAAGTLARSPCLAGFG